MTTPNRWIEPLLAEVAACQTSMPWERGQRRQAFIASRLLSEQANGNDQGEVASTGRVDATPGRVPRAIA